jgi:[protein-PII] uridylyltransferase
LEFPPNSATTESLKTWTNVYGAEMTTLRQAFQATGEGLTAIRRRAELVDRVITGLYADILSVPRHEPADFCLVAVGGYGRQELFPYSDVDLLFLSHSKRIEENQRGSVAALARTLWDLGLRVGNTSRTLAECGELHRDNLEFSVALLDSRYLAGDAQMFTLLRREIVPRLVRRDRQALVQDLLSITGQRYAKHGQTIFHLEPNLKEAPGGLRDFQVARWLTLIQGLEKTGQWIDAESRWSPETRAEAQQAWQFLSAARCLLHFRQGRDDNHLTYEFQQEVADLGLGLQLGRATPAAYWMRCYFRHARGIARLLSQVREEAESSRSSLYTLFLDWRSRLSNADFSVLRGRIFPRQTAPAAEWLLVLGLFERVARHGLELSREAERWVAASLEAGALPRLDLAAVWLPLRQILLLPHAARALRAMHQLELLPRLFPAFRAIDSLVIRDFYHRYTVDEHTFMAIEHLHALRQRPARAPGPVAQTQNANWEDSFAEIFRELERPELLFLAVLFHDVGKGLASSHHIQAGLEAVEQITAELSLAAEDCATVNFLIANHLEMSATLQRRDIFDPETVGAFAEKAATPERLKMLCLLTYADVKAVNPQALTPWKAEMLWRLYAAALNHLHRHLDDQRLEGTEAGKESPSLLSVLPPGATPQRMMEFLEGLPKRYLATQSWEVIGRHFEMFRQLGQNPVQARLHGQKRDWCLTVITRDRPFLFASITGSLAAWGMNILKADAFANRAGVVVDTFRFVDLHGTLELNPSEVVRFQKFLEDVLQGAASFEPLLASRLNHRPTRTKVEVPPYIGFDDHSSSHSTLLEVVAQDRPGLLYRVSTELARLNCNIEVALVNTEGEKAVDVFYLTVHGRKLGTALKEGIRHRLEKVLSSSHS